MKKFMISAISVVLLVCAIIVPVSAANGEPGIQPLWDNTDLVNALVKFSNNAGTACTSVLGDVDVSKIKTDIYVYKQVGNSWFYVNETHVTINDYYSDVEFSFVATKGSTYRADFTFTLTMYEVDEVITRTVYNTYQSSSN